MADPVDWGKHMTSVNRPAAALLGLFVVALVAATGAAEHDGGLSPMPTPMPVGAEGMASHVIPGQGGPHTLVLVDARLKRVGVYHVEPATGKLTLKSVRDVGPDLQLDGYNSGGLTPRDISEALRNK